MVGNTGTATATDNCGAVTVTFSDGLGSGDCPATFTRTWTATDACGNTSSCTQQISINDDTPPTISCPANVTVECDESTDPSYTGTPSASDDCSGATVTYSDSVAPGTCAQNRVMTRTWTATDGCGNTATCTQKITVQDATPPTVICPPNVTLDCDGFVSTVPSVSDNCDPNPSLTYSDSTPSGSCPKTITRTWSSTDACGNTGSCTQLITIDDDVPPVIVCPPDVTIDCDAGGGSTGTATATDNCGNVSVTFSDGPGSGDCPATFVRTWTATDDCGNSSSCDQDISINDSTPPTISCPANVTVECDDSTDPSYTGTPSASDDCSGATVTYSDSLVPGTCPQNRVITRTWTATDGCGNTASCTQKIYVQDTTPPTIVCPPSATLDCDGVVVSQPTVSDNCDPNPSVTFSDSTPSGSCPTTITRTWTATDACGNSASCNQSILIDDATPPSITCPANVTVECDESVDPSNTGTAGAADTCSSVTVTYSDSAAPGTCPNEGVITRTWTATDACGNKASCDQTIVIVDATPPTIVCPPAVTIDCTVTGGNTGTATATDNCGSATITFSDGPGSGDCPAHFTRTWTATDACGNSASCDQQISVNDDTPPVIVCPVNMTIECDESTEPGNTGTPNATDDCSGATVTYNDSALPGTCYENEVITRTWTATDGCGNTATCDQKITVRDTTPPVIACPPNATLDCEGTISGQPTVSDNCDPNPSMTYTDGTPSGECPVTLTRTWTATDNCGNTSSCTQAVLINDTTPPSITCPSDVTVGCDESTDLSNTGEPVAVDTCSSVTATYSDGPASGDCPIVFTRTWTATDACGNSASCDQKITIDDDEPPIIVCPPDVTLPCGYPALTLFTGVATASDACGSVSVTYTDGPTTGTCPYGFERTWIGTDDCGNTASCVQVISIDDITPPLLVCPPDVTVDCDDGTTPNKTGNAAAADACSVVTLTYFDGPASGTCPESFVRTWIAIDDCDNSSDCQQLITVEDDTPPVVVCPANVTLTCEEDTAPATAGQATATDNCGTPTLTYSDGPAAGECPLTFVRTWTATDECDNSSSCHQLITIDDAVPPTIVCPADITVGCLDSADPSDTGEPTVGDDCGDVTTTYSDTLPTGDCPQSFTRTWTVSDGCGNTVSCDQQITISDEEPPVIDCPVDVSLECTEPQHPYYTGEAIAVDDCGVAIVTYSDDVTAGSCMGSETIIRTWTATDECGNESSCDQFIFVDDNQPPLVICPGDVTIECGDSTNPTDIGGVQVYDPCSWITVVHEDDEQTNDCLFVIRTWTITDDCGNETNCVQHITIVDNTPPVIICPASVTIDCASNEPLGFGTATATDECSDVDLTYSDGPLSGDCPATYTRTWTATDLCGNTATCDQTVTIDDGTPPTIVCPADLTLALNASTDPSGTGEPQTNDDCGSVTVTYSDDSTGEGCEEVITRTWTATDDCGNSATCDQVITFECTQDYGDLPEGYPVTEAENGPRHSIVPGAPVLGDTIDPESDGLPSPDAEGDDTDGSDDEDGVILPESLVPGQQQEVSVTVTGTGLLNAWIDFNGDGDFSDPGEQVADDVPASDETIILLVDTPVGTAPGDVGARFRISSAGSDAPTGPADDGEVEDYLIAIKPCDFGDLPDGYPVTHDEDGPAHIITPNGPTLGETVDAELDGQPSPNADGDDTANTDDEDGVVFPESLIPGEEQGLDVTVVGTGLLNAWIDFNGDGDFDDPGEQIANDVLMNDETITLLVDTPVGTAPGDVGARFRISSVGGDAPTGLAQDGEVEDYLIAIKPCDFGDLPDDYPVTHDENGPAHIITPNGPTLGDTVDAELDGQPSPNADGDDANGSDDEDGVVLPESLVPGTQQGLDITVTGTGLLNAWIDFNGDGDFDDPGERIADDVAVSDETITLLVDTPVGTAPGDVGARFRISSAGGDEPTGLAQDGEIEDYLIAIKPCDFGDLPDGYPVTHDEDGPSHIIRDTGPVLGSTVDAEGDGQPSPDADGDDADGSDDEDGVNFVDPLMQGLPSDIEVTITGDDGFLDAWIDFNGDGDFDDPGEQIADNLPVTSGTQTITVNVPVDAVTDTPVGARFRVSTEGDLAPTGMADDGEVEDYLVEIAMSMGGLQLEKTVGVNFIGPEDTEIPYFFSVSNPGDLGVTNVVLTDTLCGPVQYLAGDVNNDDVLDVDEVWTYECIDTDFPFVQGTVLTNKATVTGQDLAGNDKMDMDEAEVPMLGFNLEKRVDQEKVCSGTEVNFTLITRLYAPEGFPIEMEVLSVIDDTCGPLMVVSGDTNAVGNLVVPPGTNVAELVNVCSFIATESFTNIATEVVRIIFDGESSGETMMETDSVGVIVDTAAPTVTSCPEDVTIACDESTDPANTGSAEGEDDCFDVTITYNDGPVTGDCPETFTRTWAIEDECGNETTCEQEITIEDTTPPTVTCPVDVTLDVAASTQPSNTGGEATSSDNCSEPAVTFSDESQNVDACVEVITRTWTATDDCGNEADCTQTITLMCELDFGDAPESFPVTLADDGARHVIGGSLILGTIVDEDGDGAPTPDSEGDDEGDGTDDEDGVSLDNPMVPGEEATFTVVVAGDGGLLQGWVDFNGDGDWDDPGEQIFTNEPVVEGVNQITIVVPEDAVAGQPISMRFRLSTESDLTTTGLAPDGEVEDYMVTILNANAVIDVLVFCDHNDNGILDQDEFVLPDMTVRLTDSQGGEVEELTAENGIASFGTLVEDTYDVELLNLPEGKDIATNFTNPVQIVVNDGNGLFSADFGVISAMTPAYAIDGYVFNDINMDDQPNEDLSITGHNDLEMKLIRNGSVLQTVVTGVEPGADNAGYFQFSNLEAGTYTVMASFNNPGNMRTAELVVDCMGTRVNFPLEGTPTSVSLASFSGTAEAGAVRLIWETGVESQNLGFFVYRSSNLDSEPGQIGDFVAATGNAGGSVYDLVDDTIQSGETYYYWLEDIDWDLVRTVHGPVQVSVE